MKNRALMFLMIFCMATFAGTAVTGAAPCVGDAEPDGDVDGLDVAVLADGSNGDIAVGDIAPHYGRTDCFGVRVPLVTGKSLSQAVAALAGAGLVPRTVSEELYASSKSGLVINQDPMGGNLAQPGSSVDLVIVAPPPSIPEEIIPPDWGGTWLISIEFSDADSNELRVRTISRDAICAGDPIGVKLVQDVVLARNNQTLNCTTLPATDTQLDVSCTIRINEGSSCYFFLDIAFTVHRTGDTMSGNGQWSRQSGCPQYSGPNETQDIFISGIRESSDPPPECEQLQSAFVQKFVRHFSMP